MKTSKLIDIALHYARRGWAVLPLHSPDVDGNCDCNNKNCSSPAKHPWTSHGVKDATVDQNIIKSWWRKWPSANIGIASGAMSGFFALDVDGRKGWDYLEKMGWPKTIQSKTHKGAHFIFQYPGFPVTNQVKKIAEDLDVRGDGGYIVAPPSQHASGSQYKWSPGRGPNELNAAPAPKWLLDALRHPSVNRVSHPLRGEIIEEGRRNSHLMSIAGSLRKQKLSEESIFAALLQENREKCRPCLDESEVKKIAESASRYDPEPTRTSESTKVLQLVSGIKLFNHGDQGYATVSVNNHEETWFIRGSMFKRWLQHRYFEAEGRALGTANLQDVVETLEARALFGGSDCCVWMRLARHEGNIYIDIGDDAWRVIEVTPKGWKIIDNSPVKFRRPRGMRPLPIPVAGGSMLDLRKFINLDGDSEVLLWAWLLAALYPKGPYPILILCGEQGSAKSTVVRVIRSLIDPNACPLRAWAREERDLMIAATNGWMLCFDNISSLSGWLSDALCRISTGGGFSTRQLHSDDDEKLFDVQRPICLNGIEEFATRGDLLDRALVLELPSIPKRKRKTEGPFWEEFEQVRPRILGALLTVLSDALRNLPKVNLVSLPRMADFTRLATAAESAFGWRQGEFLRVYEAHADDANNTALESTPIGLPLMNFMKKKVTWTGTVTDLLKQLLQYEGHRNYFPKGWPDTGQKISNVIRRIEPHLRRAGLTLEFKRNRGVRKITLWYEEPEASLVSTVSTPADDAADGMDTKIRATNERKRLERMWKEADKWAK